MSQEFFNGIGSDKFDKHIESSIPGYNMLIEQVKAVTMACTSEKYGILDVGCSTGQMLKHLHACGNTCRKIGVDLSNLVEQKKDCQTSSGYPTFLKMDWLLPNTLLRPQIGFEIVTSIFFLQFLPMHSRELALERMHASLIPGGRILLAEKVYFKSPQVQRSVDAWHRQYKLKSFTPMDILRKDKMVADEMQLKTDEGIRSELDEAGFKDIDVLFSMAGFTLYTAVKN